MPSDANTIKKLLDRQSAIATFGSFAFGETDLLKILTQAATLCAKGVNVTFAKICRYRPEHDDLLIEAGCGWRDGVIGYVVSPANKSSTQGRAFVTGEPVIIGDIASNNSLSLPPFYAEHGIAATADVIIRGHGEPWGVLEVDSPTPQAFDRQDIDFLTGFANIIAEAVAVLERTSCLHLSLKQKETLILEKDKLLEERRDREERLRELQAQLLHVARLNGMGQMTAAIAHELNQPLAAITNYVNAAKRTLRSSEDKPKAIELALETMTKAAGQALRAGTIIKSLREFIKNRSFHPTKEDLNELTEQALALALFGSVDNNVRVILNLEATLPRVMVDRVQIQQVLVNLIRNSDEAMLQVKKRELFVTTRSGDDGFANVTIGDTGPGLPKSVSEKLFTPFVTTKVNGMGLGLMICRTLVNANGGQIWAVQDGQNGTEFGFSVPIADFATNDVAVGSTALASDAVR